LERFNALADEIFDDPPINGRGTRYATYTYELFGITLREFAERQPGNIAKADVILLQDAIANWFADRAEARTVFVPCVLSRWPSPRFSVGPIPFIFLDEVRQTEFYPSADTLDGVARIEVDKFLERIRAAGASWLAVVEIENCDGERALEIADIAVDLAIAALQLVIPHPGTNNMSTLATRRGPNLQWTLSMSKSSPTVSFADRDPGLALGTGTLAQIVGQAAPVIQAIGNRIRAFVSGSFKLPRLEQSWSDAAYWLHQGLAEPLGTVAVPKLETAIEVLLGAESSKKSEARIVNAVAAFYGLHCNDPINPETQLTVGAFVKELVTDRSRILHGTWPTLASRLDMARESLESVAAFLLQASALALEQYLASDAPIDKMEPFLHWANAYRLRTVSGNQ
jgi:hypothetical protein